MHSGRVLRLAAEHVWVHQLTEVPAISDDVVVPPWAVLEQRHLVLVQGVFRRWTLVPLLDGADLLQLGCELRGETGLARAVRAFKQNEHVSSLEVAETRLGLEEVGDGIVQSFLHTEASNPDGEENILNIGFLPAEPLIETVVVFRDPEVALGLRLEPSNAQPEPRNGNGRSN